MSDGSETIEITRDEWERVQQRLGALEVETSPKPGTIGELTVAICKDEMSRLARRVSELEAAMESKPAPVEAGSWERKSPLTLEGANCKCALRPVEAGAKYAPDRGTGINISIETGHAIETILQEMMGSCANFLDDLRYGIDDSWDDSSASDREAALTVLSESLHMVWEAFYGDDSGESPR